MSPRRLGAAALLLAAAGVLTRAQAPRSKEAARPVAARRFTVVEASIPDMQAALERAASRRSEIVQQYLARIATYEDSCTPRSP